MATFQEQVDTLFSTSHEELLVKTKALEEEVDLLQKEMQEIVIEESTTQLALVQIAQRRQVLQDKVVLKNKALSKLINLEAVLQEFQEALK